MINKLNKILHTPNWLFFLLIVVLLFRIPSFFEPYSYGDEMIYLSLGEAVRQGIPLYKEIHDNKPPLLYYTAAIAGSLFWFKAILTIWHIATIYVFWLFLTYFFKKNNVLVKISTFIFALLTTIPLLEGNIANAEMFMIGPTIFAFYLLLKYKNTKRNVFIAGLFLSAAALFKMPAVFDVPAIIFYWIINSKLKFSEIKKIATKTLYLTLGFGLPIIATIVWYYFRGAFKEYVVAAFLQNVGYLSSFRPGDVQEPFLVRNGPLLIRALVVFASMVLLYLKRSKLSKPFVFTAAWLLLTLFAATLSERPYPHYLLQALAPFSILFGMLFTKKDEEQVYSIVPLCIFFLVPFYFKFWYYQSIPYYIKFVKFATKQTSLVDYRNTFGANTQRTYNIAEYISKTTNKKDKVFVAGDSSAIYALSRRLPPIRYVADYHIKDFSSETEILELLIQNKPKYVVVLPEYNCFDCLSPLLINSYILVIQIDGADIWKLIDPVARATIINN